MGCHPSKEPFPNDSKLFSPPAPIPVAIGSSVQSSLRMSSNTIVFIFGGPASKKGLIIEELTSSFNFVSISVEDIVFRYLPMRSQGMGTSIREIIEALRNDEGILSIEWVLETIAGYMSRLPNQQRFVVDIIPTVSPIMRSEQYLRRSHSRQLEEFEKKNPIAFAIEVSVRDEETLLRPSGEENGNGKEDDRRINPELNQMMRNVDEIDRGKLEKRIAEYHTCSEPFLSYFRQRNRIVNLSLTTEAVPNLVNTTRDTLLNLGFTMSRKDDHVICFTTEDNFADIDLNYYKLKVVNAAEISRAVDSLSMQIAAVYKRIANHMQHDDNFLVVIPTFRAQVPEKVQKKKRINFTEQKSDVYLDEFIKNKQHDKPPKSRFVTRLEVDEPSGSGRLQTAHHRERHLVVSAVFPLLRTVSRLFRPAHLIDLSESEGVRVRLELAELQLTGRRRAGSPEAARGGPEGGPLGVGPERGPIRVGPAPNRGLSSHESCRSVAEYAVSLKTRRLLYFNFFRLLAKCLNC